MTIVLVDYILAHGAKTLRRLPDGTPFSWTNQISTRHPVVRLNWRVAHSSLILA
jgi:hypothetical protein